MKTAEYLSNVNPKWHAAFARFVETGDAEEDFLNYLNKDEEAQQAVEAAFNTQAEAFQRMADELKTGDSPQTVANDGSRLGCPPGILAGGDVEKAVEGILALTSEQKFEEQRSEVVQRTASALKATLRPDQQELLVRTVETLTRAATSLHD